MLRDSKGQTNSWPVTSQLSCYQAWVNMSAEALHVRATMELESYPDISLHTSCA